MRMRIASALLLALVMIGCKPARAQQGAFYVSLGYQQIVGAAASTALTVPTQATIAVISIEGAAVRYRDDGTAPTATVGMPVGVGQAWQYTGTLSAVRIIQQSATATINVLYYK